jgi:phycoerythrin-associated linker protein
MKIEEFIEACAGNWFSLRTSYSLNQTQSVAEGSASSVDNSKSDLSVESLSSQSQEAIALCQEYQIAPSEVIGGNKISWDNSIDWGKPKQKGSAALVFVANRDNPQTGKLLRQTGTVPKVSSSGRYILGDDEALTLIIEDKKLYLEERLWFASPNLRLRTSLVKTAKGFSTTAFYSEIRKAAPKS